MSINIFNDLAANATKAGVGIMLFSGNDDALIPHRGTESKSCCLHLLYRLLTP